MSLQVWLPLNGSTINQGLANVSIINNGAIVSNDGKLGKCYQFSNNAIYGDFSGINSMEQMSGSCWVYLTRLSGAQYFFHFGGQGSYPCKFSLDYEGSIRSIINGTEYVSGITLAINTWYHLAVTFDGNIIKWYINGEEKAFKTVTGTFSASNHFAIGSRTNSSAGTAFAYPLNNGRMNDVRIYDHCLSPKEVKEISKGLVLHYPLNINRPLTNLNKNSTYSVYNNYSSSGTTGTLTKLDEKFLGCDVYRLTMTPNSRSLKNFQTSLWSHGVYGFRTTFKANTKYCFWIYYRPVTHQDIRVGGTASNIGGWTEIVSRHYADEWNVVGQYRNGSVTEDKTDNIFTSFYTPTAAEGVPISIDFCCPHLVEGSIEIIDNGDYQGNFNNTVEYDTSGYCYNGIITGTLITATDSPKYEISTLFNGSADIRTSNGSFSWWDFKEGTICAWMKPTVTNSSWFGSVGVQADDATGYRSFNIGDYANKASWIIGYDTSWGQVQSSVTMEVNTWYHLALTITNGTNVILYVNGESVKTGTITNSSGIINANTKFAVGIDLPGGDERFTGQISDVRFYSTALSANDIKEIYSTGAIIDNKGNVYAGELKEV